MKYSWLSKKEYEGYQLNFTYHTDRYYHVNTSEMGMVLEERRFPETVEKHFSDRLFSQWLEDPVALGAFERETLVGVVEGSIEQWHNVFRISNILVMEPYRGQGLGKELMHRMLEYAKRIPNCRGAILETQSCNYPAISFYRRQGFYLNRIDLREYSNEDVQRKEVRLDFFLPFEHNNL